MRRSVLFYVQYLLGIGHLQRSLRIAGALAQGGMAVTLVNGGPPVAALTADAAIRVVQLPPIRARDAQFVLIDQAGRPIDEALRKERRERLVQMLAEARPDAVIIEGFPFARRAFRFELDPLIATARGANRPPRLICSVRDIIARREDPARDREIVARVERDFDAVLVHGDPALIPFDASFQAAPDIADRLIYTGYVTAPPLALPAAGRARPALASDTGGRQFEAAPPQNSEAALAGAEARCEGGPSGPTGEVIVSAGGGAAGRIVLETALATRRNGCLADVPWRLLTGMHLPQAEFEALRKAAPEGVAIERFRSDLPALLRQCRVSVSQAGYNTVLDILAARARAVLVPFAAERESEQLMRAERLAALGAAELLRESELSLERLSAAIESALARVPAPVPIDTYGAENSASLIAALLNGHNTAELAAKTHTAMIRQ